MSESTSSLTADDEQMLLRLAAQAIARRLASGDASAPASELPKMEAAEQSSAVLQEDRATFVTLRSQGELRGCCGSVRAHEPLDENVVRSALTAAFGDRRFAPITAAELPELDLHISILNPPEPLDVLTEADLVAALRPGIDGAILFDRELQRQGLFLPAVWEQLPDPRAFVQRLKLKAGLPADYWSPWLRASRFTVESIHGRLADSL